MADIQATRPVEITTPLGDDVLLFQRMTINEELGRLFAFELNLLSKEPDIKFEDILGQNINVRLTLPGDEQRYFNGYVCRFSHEGTFEDFHAYNMTVHPWLWFLTRTADCRIFQQMKVPDIIKQVFRDHGFTDFEESLSGSYRTWEYCVQYRETDFNFVSRLMEQEGIYYFFKHEKDKHMLVLADSISAHEPYPGYETLPYYPPDEHLRRERDHIYDWHVSQEIQPGVYALNEYDFKRPKADLQVKSSIQRDHAQAGLEIFDYPGEYSDTGDGESYVRSRIEELQAEHEQARALGNARGLAAGSLFKLTDYPREDQNREYLIVAATHQMASDTYASGSAAQSDQDYSCSFAVLHSKQPFRPARTTPKPVVQGPQTAIVVGPSGKEIHTDKYGRVKIQFHWDRYGKRDENSSCWVRVSHPTAGKGWGAVQIPRIGQEVIVDFLEGDPDHPIITGRVYNNDNMPPYELPGSGMVSGMKSNSTPGGGGYNEMSMNDTKGEEAITVHGQYDMNTTVEHDQTNTVNNIFTETIKSDATIKITEGNLKHDVVAGTADYHVQGALTETYDATQATTVNGNLTVKSTTGAIAVSADAAHVKIDAATKLTLHSGASTIEMDNGGNIKIDGVNVTINGTMAVAIKGTMVNSEASAQHQTKGAIVVSKGSATNTLEGGTVLLNP
jgi:type VI secretion system secreted protein VgrG